MRIIKKIAVFLAFAVFCVLPLQQKVHATQIGTIVSGLNGAYGNDYSAGLNQYLFVERVPGKIWSTDLNDFTSSEIGTGYDGPMDIVVASDDTHAYVVENGGGGTLLRIDLATPDRAAATVVTSGLGGIVGQIALDEAHGYAYIVKNDQFGGLWRVNLNTGVKTLLIDGNFDTNPFGLLMSSDARFLYITELGLAGKVTRFDLQTNGREDVATGLTNPSFLDWANASEDAILVSESAAGRVSRIDLSVEPASVQTIVSGLPNINTRGVAAISDTLFFVSVNFSIVAFDVSPYDASGPIILGIGHVPFDRIFGGYADTTGDPGYFFQVRDAPFGGTLPLMINHDSAYNAPNNARWYQVLVDGVFQMNTWSDFYWNGTRFDLVTMIPHVFGGDVYYRVRNPADIWYNAWLGARINTRALSNGPHTITVRIFDGNGAPLSEVGSDSLPVQIDNAQPAVAIDEILHAGVPVNACSIVMDTCANDDFTFRITATDPDSHLRSWRLTALWGDNKSALIDSDSYSAHLPGPLWSGVSSGLVPAAAWHAVVPGDPMSYACAHTFELRAWDRAIDGFNHIHYTRYHKSLTILLECP